MCCKALKKRCCTQRVIGEAERLRWKILWSQTRIWKPKSAFQKLNCSCVIMTSWLHELRKNILEGGREAKVKFQFKLYSTKSKDNPNRYLWKSMLQNAHGGVFSGGWLWNEYHLTTQVRLHLQNWLSTLRNIITTRHIELAKVQNLRKFSSELYSFLDLKIYLIIFRYKTLRELKILEMISIAKTSPEIAWRCDASKNITWRNSRQLQQSMNFVLIKFALPFSCFLFWYRRSATS